MAKPSFDTFINWSVRTQLLFLAILLTMLGVQLVTSGLLAEMVTRTYYESQGKKIYTVRDELGDLGGQGWG